MNPTANAQDFGTDKGACQDLKVQLAQHLEQQPEFTQAAHEWMKRLIVAGAGIFLATLITAVYVSAAWKSVNPILIPVAWFVFAASVAPAMVFLGLDVVLLRAFPPVVLPGRFPRFATGNRAVWTGWAFILSALLVVAFWGAFAYAVGTLNLVMLEPLIRILAGMVGVGATISVLYSIYQKATRSR